jgi:hypothetical protein
MVSRDDDRVVPDASRQLICEMNEQILSLGILVSEQRGICVGWNTLDDIPADDDEIGRADRLCHELAAFDRREY